MSEFSERLRSEIDFAGFNQKEFAARAGIKKRSLDMYLGSQESMPPADTAVKIASALGVSVEYLVSGSEPRWKKPRRHHDLAARYVKFHDIFEDLQELPEEILVPVRAMIKAAAKQRKSQEPPVPDRLKAVRLIKN